MKLDQRNWLNNNNIIIKKFNGYDQWHKTKCPTCEGNLSVIINLKGGVYAQCWSAKCETKYKKPSVGPVSYTHL
tara:strand:+ start:1055 stop:1276 length:222 start_codon:yes stop_codon:yes gene_type:complete